MYYPSVFSFLGVCAKLRIVTISVVASECPSARNNSAPTGWIFMKLLHLSILRKSVWTFHLNLTRITGTLNEDVHTFVTISC